MKTNDLPLAQVELIPRVVFYRVPFFPLTSCRFSLALCPARGRPVIALTTNPQSFLFYWLLAPNVTSFRRNRALRGRIAPFPGAEGNSVAIFRARVASATEEVRVRS